MNDLSIVKPTDLANEINRITAIYQKTYSYASSDPEVSLYQARKTSEAICALIFVIEISKNVEKHTLGEWIILLKKKNKLPKHIEIALDEIISEIYSKYV